MCAAAGERYALDGRRADETRLAATHVDLVLKLKEAADAVGIDVIGDRGAAELDGVAEDVHESFAEAEEFVAGEASGLTARSDAGSEERLIGVDVANSVEQ